MKTIQKIRESKMLLAIICLIAGGYGVHRFIMKRWISGAIYLVLGLFGGIGGLLILIDLFLIWKGKLGVVETLKAEN